LRVRTFPLSKLAAIAETMKDKNYLIKFLSDKTVDLGARDDCAMDLANYDSEDVLEILHNYGSDPNEDQIIQGSCGESLAEIMVRTGVFRREYILGLSKSAIAEFRGYIENCKPEWLVLIVDL
jgi:hypothetical protein